MAYLAVSMNLFEVELYKRKGGKGKVKDCHQEPIETRWMQEVCHKFNCGTGHTFASRLTCLLKTRMSRP